jgi:deoxyribonuclease V
MIACLDVDYHADRARAACCVLAAWSDRVAAFTCVANVDDVQPYRPAAFYLRELPCLLAVLRELPRLPVYLVVDGYVWLSAGTPGLGAHLHRAIGGAAAVIGVAKRAFAGNRSVPVQTVLRGRSARPLYVTSVGVDPVVAADCIRRMHGAHRIPTALRLVDRLARGGDYSWRQTTSPRRMP